MKKKIIYTGYTATPSDYDCADGSLAAAINLAPENGSMSPILPPTTLLGPLSGCKPHYIHQNSGYTNYIIVYNDGIHITFTNKEKNWEHGNVCTLDTGETITDIIAVGNTLIISTNTNLHFCFYNKDEKAYTYLGNQLPEIKMRFALLAEAKTGDHSANLTLSETSSSESSFETLTAFSVSLTVKQTPSVAYIGTFSQWEDIENIGLEKDTDYKFIIKNTYGAQIQGQKADGSWETFVTIASHTRDNASMVRIKEKYVAYQIRLKLIRDRVHIGGTVAGYVQIYKGFSAPLPEGARHIYYDSTNYGAVMAAVNKFVADNGVNNGRFIYPFFVRYALRLVDGTHACISAPVLLVPNTGYAPFISYDNKGEQLDLYAFFAQLQYAFVNTLDEGWKDIVAGVDIFASQQAYPYKQGQAYDDSKQLFNFSFITDTINGVKGTDYGISAVAKPTATLGYNRHDLYTIANEQFDFGTITESKQLWSIVRIAENEDQRDNLKDTANFYLLHSFKFDEVKPLKSGNIIQYSVLDIDADYLSTLVTRATLADDSISQCRFFNAHLVNYNSRLHLFDFSMQHPAPATPEAMNGRSQRNFIDHGSLHTIVVYMHTAQGDRSAAYSMTASDIKENSDFPWFFYPHNRAYAADLVYKKTATDTDDNETAAYYTASLDLQQHELLNGAYWMADSISDPSMTFTGPLSADPTDALLAKVNDISTYPSSVLQSQATMPFVFSDTMLNTLPVTRIYHMSSAAKALSQGQFGQFPLYAFTTEGIWALEVSATGTYSARQPITRDVAISNASITQLDSAVVFAANRGIMLLSGSESTCISDILQESTLFSPLKLPAAEKIVKLAGLDNEQFRFIPFMDYIQGCRMIYDYTHQRIIVYNPSCRYAYVYSLKSKEWGMMASNIAYSLNSYPDAIAVTNDNSVVNFSVSSTEEGQSTNTLIFTRPFKLDAPDILKTVDTIIQRGMLQRDHVQQVLYGSRDLIHWHIVWSSTDIYLRGFRGTPYKYFRLALLCQLTAGESLSGCTCQYTLRYDNKPR